MKFFGENIGKKAINIMKPGNKWWKSFKDKFWKLRLEVAF